MLIFRYLAKEVFLTLVALTSILLLIFMSNQVVIYLNRAANGIIPGMLVMKLMMLELPNLMSLLLPLGFYFALLLAYGRLYAESEMTILQACGFGSGQLLKYSLCMALIVALITSMMVAINPRIAYERAKLLQTSGVKTLIKMIVPGRFRAINGDGNVFYVGSMNQKHTEARDFFLARLQNNQAQKQWDIMWADKGYIQADKTSGQEFLVLEQGKNYQGVPGHANYQIAKFKRYQTRLPEPNVRVKNDIRTVRFTDLLPYNNPDRKKAAELQWRISIPLMVFTLTLVGVPLSRVNPRAGKYAKLLPAVVLCVLYANFMFIGRDWIVAGVVPIWLGLWWLHLCFALLGIGLIWRNRR